MKVVLRADAGLEIGTGHVVRCLTLATALVARGHECRMICRDLPGHLGARITAAGLPLDLLPAPGVGFARGPEDPPHAGWAGVPWQQDAAETRTAAIGADWLVVDHYGFDARWERAACPPGTRLLALDDLADRAHDCALLLDSGPGRHGRDYDPLVPPMAERLIGPRHALLRPEFAAARPDALARRDGRLRRVLIAMGGVDAGNATGRLLDLLATRWALGGPQVVAVLGATAPHLAAVQEQAATLPFLCEVRAGIADMAATMATADLAIGAGGGTALERCALGLPSLLVVLAANQQAGAAALADAGAGILLGATDDAALPARLDAALDRLADPTALKEMAARAVAICDGDGTARVVAALEAPLTLRPATVTDAETVWNWRESVPPEHFRAGANPPLAAHKEWFAAALADPDRQLLIALDAGGAPVGHLRLDHQDQQGIVSILLAPAARGRGYGRRLLAMLEPHARAAELTTLIATVAVANAPSIALFTAAGYLVAARDDDYMTLHRTL